MPNIENELTKLGDATVIANSDLSHGYWQHPLHPDSQERQSFVTLDGIFSPTRVLCSTTNAVLYLQSNLTSIIPDELRTSLLLWLDESLLHCWGASQSTRRNRDSIKNVWSIQCQTPSLKMRSFCLQSSLVWPNYLC